MAHRGLFLQAKTKLISRTPILVIFLLAALTSASTSQDHWPEIRGPQQNYHLTSNNDYPTKWSVITGENIRWTMPLPETGHSGIAAWENKLFLTCFRKLTAKDIGPKGTWVAETRGYCLAADTGEIVWSCELPGKRPNQVNGTFTDSTTPKQPTPARGLTGYVLSSEFEPYRGTIQPEDIAPNVLSDEKKVEYRMQYRDESDQWLREWTSKDRERLFLRDSEIEKSVEDQPVKARKLRLGKSQLSRIEELQVPNALNG